MNSSPESFVTIAFPSLGSATAVPGADRDAERARQRGHAAGFADGTRKAEARMTARIAEIEADAATRAARAAEQTAAAVTALNAATVALENLILPVATDVDDTLIGAAMDLAEAVLGRELADSGVALQSALDRVRTHPDAATAVSIRLNPADLASLEPSAIAAVGIRLIADPRLLPGDAMADLAVGFIDARIGAALARVRHELADSLHEGSVV